MTTREHEHTLNVWLAEELKRQGLDAVAERPSQRRRVDVKVILQRTRGGAEVVVAVEAEQGQNPSNMAEAVRDAEARLPGRQNLARCAVALCYPDLTTPESLPTAQLMWTVRDGQPDADAGAGAASWQRGDVEALATAIRLAPAQLGDPDGAAATLSSSLDTAVTRLAESQKRMLAQALDLPAQTRNGRRVRNPWDAPAKRALLVIATAVMFHSRLDVHLPDSRPEYDSRTGEPFPGPWPPVRAQICAVGSDSIGRGSVGRDPVGSYLTAWELILALDYKPIFETARAALLAVPPDPSFGEAVGIAAEAALAAARDTASLPPRPAGAHLSHRAGHGALRRLFLHHYAGRHFAVLPGHSAGFMRLARRRRHRAAADNRPGLRHRNLADGRRRTHPRTGAAVAGQSPPGQRAH